MATRKSATKSVSPVDALLNSLAHAHSVEESARNTAGAERTQAVNACIDSMAANKARAADITEAITGAFDTAVTNGWLLEKTAKDYLRGVTFALANAVPWSPSLHGLEFQVKALNEAGHPIPKALAKKAQEMADKAAAKQSRGARQAGASLEHVKATLVKALAEARELTGEAMLAAAILDCITERFKDFKEA